MGLSVFGRFWLYQSSIGESVSQFLCGGFGSMAHIQHLSSNMWNISWVRGVSVAMYDHHLGLSFPECLTFWVWGVWYYGVFFAIYHWQLRTVPHSGYDVWFRIDFLTCVAEIWALAEVLGSSALELSAFKALVGPRVGMPRPTLSWPQSERPPGWAMRPCPQSRNIHFSHL